MDPYDAVFAQLKSSQEQGLEAVRSRLQSVAEQIDELAQQVKGSLNQAIPKEPAEVFPVDALEAAVANLRGAAPAGAAAAPGGMPLTLLRRLDAARSQSELLRELLNQLGERVARAAVLVIREGTISAWSGVGFANADALRQWRAQLTSSEVFSSFANDPKPKRFAPGSDGIMSEWLDAAETPRDAFLLPVCLRGKLVGGIYVDHGTGRAWDPSDAQVLIAVICWLIDTLGFRQTVPSPMVEELEDLVGDLGEPEPEPPSDGEFDPSATVRVDTAQMAAMAAAAEAETAAPAAEPAPSGGALSPEEEARHEEARRFARLLVSEIKLYNEAEVERGRANNDLYQRLKEDIDRSREMFDKRIPPEVRAVRDYFHEELVRVLADGDSNALGM